MKCAGQLCTVCAARPRCDKCRRHLPESLFDANETTCRTCLRKRRDIPNRVAFNGIVQERDIDADRNSADLQTYMDSVRDQVLSILQEAINNHM
jgi:hypothetical protein